MMATGFYPLNAANCNCFFDSTEALPAVHHLAAYSSPYASLNYLNRLAAPVPPPLSSINSSLSCAALYPSQSFSNVSLEASMNYGQAQPLPPLGSYYQQGNTMPSFQPLTTSVAAASFGNLLASGSQSNFYFGSVPEVASLSTAQPPPTFFPPPPPQGVYALKKAESFAGIPLSYVVQASQPQPQPPPPPPPPQQPPPEAPPAPAARTSDPCLSPPCTEEKQTNTPSPLPSSGGSSNKNRTNFGKKHPSQSGSPSEHRVRSRRPPPYEANILYKTQLCRDFMRHGPSGCPRGKLCQFAHGLADLHNPRSHPLFQTSLCKEFLRQGFCSKPHHCYHAHDPIAAAAAAAGEFARVHQQANAATAEYFHQTSILKPRKCF